VTSVLWWLRGVHACAVALVGVLVVLALLDVTPQRHYVHGVAVGDEVIWSDHDSYCDSDELAAVVVEAWDDGEGPIYRVQPTCARVPVGPTFLATGVAPLEAGEGT
jgi:hypothetical protein